MCRLSMVAVYAQLAGILLQHHHMMFIERMDADTGTRRLSLLALVGGDTGKVNYTDLMNGPMDHGVFNVFSVYVIMSLCTCHYVPLV